MDVRLPSGVVLKGIPEGTSKDEIKRKAIAAGLATEADFGEPAPQQLSPQQISGEVPVLPEQQAMVPQEPVQAAPERTMGDRIMGGLEAGASAIASGVPAIIGQTVGAAEGALEYLSRGDFSQPPGAPGGLVETRAMQGVQRMTAPFQPPSEAGRETLQDIGEALAPVGGAVAGLAPISTGVGRAISQSVKSATQVPGSMVPERLARLQMPRFERQKIADVRRALAENTTESVGWKLNENGNPVPNMVERNLLEKGVSDKTIAATRILAKQDKRSALRMLDLAEDYVKGKEGSDLNRPSLAIGERIMERFNVLKNAQRQASRDIGRAVSGKEIKGRPVDVSDIRNEFAAALEERGAIVADDGIRFRDLSGFDVADKKLLNETYRTLGRQFDDASELHRVKQALTDRLNYDQKVAVGGRPLSDQGEALLKSVRGRINEKLREMSPSYAEANDRFSQVANATRPFAEALGRKFDPESARAENFTGTQLRKALSNYQNADQLVEAVDGLNATANKFGGNFGNEIIPLVRLNSDLEGMLGSFAPQSLQGVVEKAGQNVMQRTMGGMAETAIETGKAVKRRTSFWDAPVQEKIDLINQLREQIKEQK